MNKTICWYCKIEFEYNNEQYRDVVCPYCKVLNSILNPNKPELTTEVKPKSTHDEWVEKREREDEMANLGDLRLNLRKEDVQAGDVVEFIDAGEIKDIDFSMGKDGSDVKTVFQIAVQLPNGKNKLYIPNATTRNILSEKWGEDTDKWVNKKAEATFIDQLSFGKLTKVLVLKPID